MNACASTLRGFYSLSDRAAEERARQHPARDILHEDLCHEGVHSS